MPLLFSYGTLQDVAVQIETFGRELVGFEDELVGYEASVITIAEEAFAEVNGAQQAIVTFNGHDGSRVCGMVFELTERELELADEYEPAEYERIETTLASGRQAWVYAAAVSPGA